MIANPGRLLLFIAIFAATMASVPLLQLEGASGPEKGAVIAIGGGALPPQIAGRFVDLAGGPHADFVFIPTANDKKDITESLRQSYIKHLGVSQLTVLHTRSRTVANSDTFVAPLRTANGVFIDGGRQWRLTDAYLNTFTQKELLGVLERGGVIAGTSAGVSVLASFMVRGAPAGNEIVMAPGHETGFGFIQGVAIDQHVNTRHREADLIPVVAAHPDLLGIGLDAATAIVVRGTRLRSLALGMPTSPIGQVTMGNLSTCFPPALTSTSRLALS